MPYPLTLGSVLLRTQRTALPRTFWRSKSITAAIEKGRGSGPDRFSGPRPGSYTRTSVRNDEAVASRYEDREGGRSRPSRSKSSIGARRRRWEDEDAAPRRKELRKSGGRPDESAVDRRIRDQDRERPARFDREKPARSDREELPSRFAGRPPRDAWSAARDAPRPGREGREQSDRPPRRAERTFDRDERAPRGNRDGRDRDGKDRDGKDRHGKDRHGRDRHGRDRHGRDGRDDFQKDDRPPRRPQRSFDPDSNPEGRSLRRDRSARTAQPDRSSRFDRMDRVDRTGRRSEHTDGRSEHIDGRSEHIDGRSEHTDGPERSIPSRADPRDRAPDSLPFTTAASEFIYGYSSVLAAIRAQRRQFYKLYVNSRGLNRDILLARAKAADLRQITREVGDQYDRAFDKASSGRPHNGFILEASPLPVPPITELQECVKESGQFNVVLGPQTKEELAVNGSRTAYTSKSPSRFPLVLYLDGILDEGNLGAIARSAYFLGVDALVTPTRQSAPWSHIAVKASAGAAEAIPLFRVAEPADFLGRASRNGWRCYAAAAPAPRPKDEKESTTDIVYTQARSGKVLHAHTPVLEHPTILMLGAEGAGLRSSLLNLAHYNVGIRHGRNVDEVGVDSLNVSVAAGLLCHDILANKAASLERDPENVVFQL